jgi:hypothetical protein
MDTGNKQPENESLAMKDDYLWDGSGEPDPDIQSLEALLGKFRHNGRTPVFLEIVRGSRWTLFPQRMRLLPVLATTAAAVVGLAIVTLFLHGRKPGHVVVAAWDVSRVAGTPGIGPKAITGKEGTSRLSVGQVLETDHQSWVSLQADDIGQIEVEPSTRLRLVTMSPGLQRIALDRGTIHARIWAPPGQFVVDTPSAVTVDLGCAYTLQVDESGASLVRTSLGWVGFKLNGRESFIPAGAACATKTKLGPGTPYFEDASPEFRAALARFDFEDSTVQQRAADVAIVVGKSRKRDVLTLWHLLTRVDEEHRALIYDRLRALAPAPEVVTREGILRLDQPMLDRWWNALGFDDISVWRHWQRSWTGTSAPVREK